MQRQSSVLQDTKFPQFFLILWELKNAYCQWKFEPLKHEYSHVYFKFKYRLQELTKRMQQECAYMKLEH